MYVQGRKTWITRTDHQHKVASTLPRQIITGDPHTFPNGSNGTIITTSYFINTPPIQKPTILVAGIMESICPHSSHLLYWSWCWYDIWDYNQIWYICIYPIHLGEYTACFRLHEEQHETHHQNSGREKISSMSMWITNWVLYTLRNWSIYTITYPYHKHSFQLKVDTNSRWSGGPIKLVQLSTLG